MILRFECYGAIALAIATGFAAAGPTGDGSLKPRILGGTTTNKSDYPFIVYLHNAAEKTFCGGSIISADWILTAAHCIKTAKASDIAVYIGQADYNPDPSKASSVSSITTHPGYDDSTMVNDLSLLKLSSPITSSGNSSTISIDSTSVGDGVTVTALGWGYTSPTGSSASTQLKKGDLKTLSKAECSPKDSKFTGNNGATICVAADTGTDTCPGDSGGPLIRQVDGKNVLVGITSFGTAGSGQSITVNCGGNGMVSLFTHAYYYESFINSTTGGLREIQGAHISGG
ncbi:hypothetical protein GGI26_000259 [Coemansia sp. RSA 1358]|nr:trypsin-like cysteine/serine peptidase domain-containing protein [Coemansia spiralis]KAJ1995900.1 hypothetical protein EDC05_000560 [Coemansia umbellata]KAJ2625798.1 hypothetical protein GGI26_000259 [Coemansia sp. RSA 1358]